MIVRKAIRAGLDDDGSEVMRSEELNTGMMAKLKKSFHQAKQKDAQRQQCAAGVAEDDRLLAADHCASPRAGRGRAVVCMPSFPLFPT